jgi:hypothetical protein
MHFSVPILAILASQAMAKPAINSQARREVDTSDEALIANAIQFAASPDASCNVISCASIIADAACIALDIEKGDVSGVVGCVSGGVSAVSNGP